MHYKLCFEDDAGKLIATEESEATDDLSAVDCVRRKYRFGLNVRCDVRDCDRIITIAIARGLRPAPVPRNRLGRRRAT